MCRARSGHAAAACIAWCSAGKAAGQGSFESVASINEPSQHEDGQHVAHASDAVGWDRSCGVSWVYLWVCRARSEHVAAACKAWCSAGKAAGQGSFESVASINEPSQHEMGSTSLVHRMLLGKAGDVPSCVELEVPLGVQSA